MSERVARLEIANRVIETVSQYGRRFFSHNGRVSRFEFAGNCRLWYLDGYSQKRIYVMYRRGRWRGFTEGGTLRAVIENLADYIMRGDKIRNHFGPWPEHICDGDLWGYGKEQAAAMRDALSAIIGPPAPRYDKLSAKGEAK